MNKFWKIFGTISLAALLAFSVQPGVMAETHTLWSTKHPATDPGIGSRTPFYQGGVIDCNNQTYFKSGVTHGDVIQVANIPENTVVKAIYLRTTRGTLTSGTSAIMGDGANTQGFIMNTAWSGVTVPSIDLSKAQSGISMWTAGHYAARVISGVSAGVSFGSGAGVSNYGAYFSTGVSPYIGKDTVDMTVYVNKTATSGVTPAFEYMIECIKWPTN